MWDEKALAKKARKETLAAIGQSLREHYDAVQPLPKRLSDLLKKIEPSSEGQDQRP